jgi:hypothetical protein
MCTGKWRLCGKIKKGWVDVFLFVTNKACYFTKKLLLMIFSMTLVVFKNE